MKQISLAMSSRMLGTSLVLVVLSVGLIACGQERAINQHTPDIVIEVSGTRPNWDVAEMVNRADAVVIGTLTGDLGSKTAPADDDDPPLFHYQYKDYSMSIDESLYPEKGMQDSIAILVEAGAAGTDDSVLVRGDDDVPAFFTDEKVLVFLESLKGSEFAEGVGRPVPKGFTEDTYYQVIIGAGLGKLTESDDKWEDSRTGETVTLDDIREAVSQKDS